MNKFLVIDGNSLINRAFYALPLLTNENGEFSNAVYGFCSILIKTILEHKPTHIAVAFDYGKKTFRHKMFTEYKGTRKETPAELKSQFAILKKVLAAMGITIIEQEGIEADDILGTMCKATEEPTIILSGDKDVLQLIDSTTNVWLTKKGVSEIEMLDIEALKKNYGFSPEQVIEYKALAGDSSDNIPGVKGIGEKTAKTLLEQYGDVENIYANIDNISGSVKTKLIEGKESAKLSKLLATIKTDCKIDFDFNSCTYEFPFNEKVHEIFEYYEFRSLLKRKELFAEDFLINQSEVEFETHEIKNLSELEPIIKRINSKGTFAINYGQNIEFSCEPSILYKIIPQLTLFDSLTSEDVIETFKPILDNPAIEKIVLDAKLLMNKFNTKLAGNIFDISIASYLLNETPKQLTANEYFAEKKKKTDLMLKYGLFKLYNEVELPLLFVLSDMEKCGFKVDIAELNNLSCELDEKRDNLLEKIYELAGENFNVNSPKQLAQILFTKLGIKTFNNKKESTAIDKLSEIADMNPIIPLVLEYRKINKLKSTYVDVYKNLIKEKGDLIHTVFNQTLTSTGRLSSSEPNLQNIPVRSYDGKRLRKIFISRFKNGSILSADYNQIELRMLANFCGDENMINCFLSGEDVHASTASKIFNKPLSAVTKNERRLAKAVNFGVIYGISDYGLSQEIGTSRAKAKEYIDEYFAKYPKVKEYMDKNIAEAETTGQIKTFFGRIRKIPEISSSNYLTKSFGMRAAMNMPLQGTASDIIKIAMLKTFDALQKQNLKSKLILTIHDELIIDVYPGEEELAKKLIKNSMESFSDFKVPLTVDVGIGKNYAEC